MKQLAQIFTILILLFNNSGVTQDYIRPDIDSALLRLLESAHKESKSECNLRFTETKKILSDFYNEVRTNKSGQFDFKQFASYNSTVVKVLERYVKKSDFEKIKFFVAELLYEQYSMRSCFSSEAYPLDGLLTLSQSYKAVKTVVKDPMMDLLEWYEFIDLINTMVDDWQAYDCIDFSIIQKHFPNISESQHSLLKEKSNECLSTFLKSLESGYRLDFEIPCEEFGESIHSILFMYSK